MITKLERAHERLRIARAMIATVVDASDSSDDTVTVLVEAEQILDEVTRYLARRRQRQIQQQAGLDEATAQKAVGQ